MPEDLGRSQQNNHQQISAKQISNNRPQSVGTIIKFDAWPHRMLWWTRWSSGFDTARSPAVAIADLTKTASRAPSVGGGGAPVLLLVLVPVSRKVSST